MSRSLPAQTEGGGNRMLAQLLEFLERRGGALLVACLGIVTSQNVVGIRIPGIQLDGVLQRLLDFRGGLPPQNSSTVSEVRVGERRVIALAAIDPGEPGVELPPIYEQLAQIHERPAIVQALPFDNLDRFPEICDRARFVAGSLPAQGREVKSLLIFRVQLAGETEAVHRFPVTLRFIEKAAQMVVRISIARIQGNGLLHVALKVIHTLQHEGSQGWNLARLGA